MSTPAEAVQRADNKNNTSSFKGEPASGNNNMPPKPTKEQVAKNEEKLPMSGVDCEKMVKQRQSNRVDRMLNRRIPKFRTDVQGYLETCQSRRDFMVPPTDLQFNTDKTEKHYTKRWEIIHNLCEKNSAALLFIEQFESEFRDEWKGKKKESVEKRHRYVKPKRKEFRKIRIAHEDAVREQFEKLGITLPQVDDQDSTDEEADMRDLKGNAGKKQVGTVEEEEMEGNERDVKL